MTASRLGHSPPSPAEAGEGVAEGDGWGVARRFDPNSIAQTAPRSDSGGDLLSAPHPAFGHLPRFAEKGEAGRLQLAERWVNAVANKGGGTREPSADCARRRPRSGA